MKKFLAFLLVAVLVLSFAACTPAGDDFKIGFICLHDEQSTYDLNFINAAKEAQEALGLTDDQVIIKTNIPEGDECYVAAKDLVDQGCKIVFANSFGHEEFLVKAAREFPEVEFCHATGTLAHTEGLANYHNAFASIYEGRYLAGVAAGLKLNELKAAGKLKGDVAKMGYVGAYTYAEVISGYTSFYLGAKSVCPEVIMDVKFTGSWFDPVEEKNAAQALIAAGADLISQHADSMGAPSTCEEAGIPNVSYNGSTVASCPNTFIVSSRINWAPYYEYIVNCVKEGKAFAAVWCGGLDEGSVVLTEINDKAAAAGSKEKIDAVTAEIKAGTLKIFDTAKFTINNGQTVAADHKADVDTDEAYTPDTVVIVNGIFEESVKRSAPYFDLRIDGITLLNEIYD